MYHLQSLALGDQSLDPDLGRRARWLLTVDLFNCASSRFISFDWEVLRRLDLSDPIRKKMQTRHARRQGEGKYRDGGIFVSIGGGKRATVLPRSTSVVKLQARLMIVEGDRRVRAYVYGRGNRVNAALSWCTLSSSSTFRRPETCSISIPSDVQAMNAFAILPC
ncbi:uncharacterized protein ARMOST_16124 [Armillaria ostoyae]|uniref:Uncharacterized protein n=1 Tax=Armillaria ostoyae TaxID=47428 RepID=A0A284RVA0_ARMOS|nr:uncharacterized protein ARMOST_16124 [Armillaria ostoyae]